LAGIGVKVISHFQSSLEMQLLIATRCTGSRIGTFNLLLKCNIAEKTNTSEGYVRVVLSRYKNKKPIFLVGDNTLILQCDPSLTPFLESFLRSEAFKIAFQDYVYGLTFGRYRPYNPKIKILKL